MVRSPALASPAQTDVYPRRLIFIFFGLDGSGIDESPKFDPILGPILFVSFAALSNTLLTSVLVAILSTTYASIASDAVSTVGDPLDLLLMHRPHRLPKTCSARPSHALRASRPTVCSIVRDRDTSLAKRLLTNAHADLPPLNLIALCVMWPLSHFLSPRWFHKVNVFATRTLSLPILLLIALYERQSAAGSVFIDWMGDLRLAITARLPRKWAEKLSLLEGAHWECEAVFEYTPSGDEKSSDEDDFDDESFLGGPDEAEELLVDAPAAQRVSNRASAVVDPARMSAAHQQMRPHSSVGSSASSVIGTPGTSTPSLPVPLSRQASFAAASEASTIRATSKSRPPRYPGLPAHAPDSSTGSSTSSSTARAPSQSFLSDATEAVFSSSPPSSPQKRPAPHTRFASPPRAVASSPSSSGVKLRRAHTVHERLPANAGAAQPGKSRRGSTGNHDGSGFDRIEFLSTSAPLRESPLARLYGSAQPGEEDFSAAAGSGTAQPGTRAGAVRRRMSMGPATGGNGGHGRRSSDFGVGAGHGGGASPRGRAPDEPSTAQLMELVQGLVATVARLEEKLDDERRRNEDDA